MGVWWRAWASRCGPICSAWPGTDPALDAAWDDAAGVPIDGVGLQGHFAFPTPSAAQLTANLARFAAAGLDIRYTEIDVRLVDGTDNLAVQGTAYGTIIDACLAQPRCKALSTWGFTDKYSWIPGTFSGFGRALPFDQLFGPKPAYLMLRDALARP